jgi:hypothetical protein
VHAGPERIDGMAPGCTTLRVARRMENSDA